MHKKPKKSFIVKKSYIIITVLLILVAGAYFFSHNGIAANVNGKKIYEKRVDALFNSQTTDPKLTKQNILQRLIDTQLLVDYITSKKSQLSDEEFNSELNDRLKSNNITLDELQKQLSLSGATLDDVRDSLNIELFVQKEINSKIHVTQADIDRYRLQSNSTSSDKQIESAVTANIRSQILTQIIANQKKTASITIYTSYQ